MRYYAAFLSACLVSAACGCDRSPSKPRAALPTQSNTAQCDDGHDHSEGHDHANKSSKHDANAEFVELGTVTAGAFTVRATRDMGDIKPGGDAPIDVWVTTADGAPATVSAVRFWIGADDAKGSLKAKADIEDPKEPNRWHTHVEVPQPLPAGSRLWVEIEPTAGSKHAASFDLKA